MPPYSTNIGGGSGITYTAGTNVTISTDNVISSTATPTEQEEFFYITGMFKDMASLSGAGSYDFMEWTSNQGADVIPSITCVDNWTLVKASFCWGGPLPATIGSGESYTIKIGTINAGQSAEIANVTYKTPTLFTITSVETGTQTSLVSGDLDISFSQADRICIIGEELVGPITPNTQDGQVVLKFKLTDTPSTQALNTFTGGTGINISPSNVISVDELNSINSISILQINTNGSGNSTGVGAGVKRIEIDDSTISARNVTTGTSARVRIEDFGATDVNTVNLLFDDGTAQTTATPTWLPNSNPNYLTPTYVSQFGVEYIGVPVSPFVFVQRDISFDTPFTDVSSIVINANVMYNNSTGGNIAMAMRITHFTNTHFSVLVNQLYSPTVAWTESSIQIHWSAFQVPQKTNTDANGSWSYSITNET